MITLKITASTILKYAPLQSAELPKGAKYQQFVESGTTIALEEWKSDRNSHLKIKLSEPIEGYRDWFVYSNHVKIEEDVSLNSSICLTVPYKSQLDNEYNPTGSCNVTSLAMCLAFYGRRGETDRQLEDELYLYMDRNGLDRHNPLDLAFVAEQYGIKDYFTESGTIEQCRKHIANGNPCIIHGWFSRSGHIIVLVGYDDSGFVVHDPYGEWCEDGYDTEVSGAFLHYSYDLINRVCIPDGSFWVHYISK